MTLDISYDNDKKVRIRKIHKDIESEELRKSKYKVDDHTYIFDNQIDLDVFSTYKIQNFDFFRRRNLYLTGEEFKTQRKDLSRYGADLFRIEKYYPESLNDFIKNRLDFYVSLKNPDEQLINNLCRILHQLCMKYLKTSIMIIDKDSIICRIDDCSYSMDVLKKFLEELIIITEKTI